MLLRTDICVSVRIMMGILFLQVFSLYFAFSSEQQVGSFRYTQINGVWYTVEADSSNYRINAQRIEVRLNSKGDVRVYDFSRANLPTLSVINGPYVDGFYLVQVPPDSDAFIVANKLLNSGDFMNVAFDTYGECWVFPNDPKYPDTPAETSQTDVQANLYKIGMEHAWEITTGSSSVIIGIADVGVDLTHPDLVNNISANYQWDFKNNDPYPDADDGTQHGTYMMGVIGASTNNNKAVAGIVGGWDTTFGAGTPMLPFGKTAIVNMKAGENSNGTDAPVASWMARAVDTLWKWSHVKVINLSVGISETNTPFKLAIKRAADSGDCVIVGAAGDVAHNYTTCRTNPIVYPAKDTNVIAVGGSDRQDNRWWIALTCNGSPMGPELDVVAPAQYIPTTRNRLEPNPNTLFTLKDGTSLSAAHVSGQAGLIRTINPQLNRFQVRDIITSTAGKVPEMADSNFTVRHGYGRINVYKSLKAAIPVRHVGNSNVNTPTSISGGTVSNTFAIVKNHDSLNYANYSYAKLTGNLSFVNTPLVIEKKVRVKTGAYQLDTTRIIAEPEGEILPETGGKIVLGSQNIIFQGTGSCIGASGGTIQIKDGATVRVNNGGVIASFSPSTIQLGNNSTLLIDTTGKLQWFANTTWTFGTNSKVLIYGTVNVDAGDTLHFPSSSNIYVYPSAVFTMGSNSRINLYGTLNITDSTTLSLPSNGKLFVYSGAQLKFGAGAKLVMNGSLDAQGSSGSPITFTSSKATPAAGDWYGIQLLSGPNTIKYCNIRYAKEGVVILNNAGTTIENGEITNCSDQGVYIAESVSYGALRIKGAKIKKNNNDGVVVYNSWAAIEASAIIDSNSRYGVYVPSNSSVRIDHSYVRNNGSNGIEVSGSSTGVYLAQDLSNRGYNTVTDNSGWQVRNNTSATTLIGHKFLSCDCPSISTKQPPRINVACNSPCAWIWHEVGGYNTIYGTNYWVKNSASNTLYADLTDWGSCPEEWPSGVFEGAITTDYPLGGCDLEIAIQPVADEPVGIKKGEDSQTSAYVGPDRNKVAREYINYLKAFLVEYPYKADHVLPILSNFVGEFGVYKNLFGESWEDYLATLESSHPLLRLRKQATIYRIQEKMNKGDFGTVLSMTNNLLQSNLSNAMWLYCQTQRISALVRSGNIESAKQAYASISQQAYSIDARGTYEIGRMVARFGGNDEVGGSAVSQPVPINSSANNGKVPQTYKLLQNFPNPFNPTTFIRYEIPEDNHVVLKIFNTIGQEILTLANEFQNAGYKSISFDASNLPSGMYFYRLQAGSFVETRKMMLLK